MKYLNRVVNLTLVSLLMSTVGLSAIAQPSPNSPNLPSSPNTNPPPHPDVERPGMSPLELLQLEQVQKELELTPEQIEKLKKIAEQQPPLQRTRGLARQTPITDQEEKAFAQQANVMREQIEGVLDQEQLNRLRGFLIQANGFIPELNRARTRGNAPDDPLKLTAEQKEKLAKIEQESKQSARSTLQTARTRGNDDPVSTCQKLEAISNESDEAIMSVLSKEQQEALEELKGPKLEGLPDRNCTPRP